jgi:hypothetical protein
MEGVEYLVGSRLAKRGRVGFGRFTCGGRSEFLEQRGGATNDKHASIISKTAALSRDHAQNSAVPRRIIHCDPTSV